ncbi:MAG: acetate--CoA ligase family protein [Paracoccaceae bacterium]|nr:acetate--CoA ligase family protein [Paracoccaceae bacterium]
MTPKRRKNFRRLLKPRHIAFIGGRYAIIAINEARRRGFDGEMLAVNPTRTDLVGVECVASIEDLPVAPDAVYLAIPADNVVDALRSLSVIGAGGVVCFSAGFKEAGNTQKEKDLVDATGDMALIGPNCYGIINYIDNSALWSFEHGGWSPGYGAAIITQSGMFSSDITMSQRSLPLAYMVSAGNQAVLGPEDFLEFFAEDPAVRAIGLHLEGLQNIPKFGSAALKALSKGKPVVVLKTGSSTIGSELTVSHTGSLSGSAELYEAFFQRVGIISVTNPSQFLETLKLLCIVGAPKGKRVAGFTCSGGGATMLADHAERIDLVFPVVDPKQEKDLSALLPDIATVSNPLDYTTPIWGQAEMTYPVFAKAISAIEADTAVLLQDYPAAGLDSSKSFYRADAIAFAEATTEKGLPAIICATLPENMDLETRQLLISKGVAPMQGIHETLNAIQDSANWKEARSYILSEKPEHLLRAIPSSEKRVLPESEGKDWFKRNSFNVPEGKIVSAQQLGKAANAVGYPVALKMISRRLAHKTEAGAVVLNLKDEGSLRLAASKMKSDVAAYDAKAVSDLFLVEAMSPNPLAELIINFRQDPQFGAALVLGSGGVLVELLADSATLLLPTRPIEIIRVLKSLRVGRLLEGFRGRPAADIEQVATEIYKLSVTYQKNMKTIAEIEINPLFVYQAEVSAIDVLIQVPNEK